MERVVQLITLSLPTRVEVELGCDNIESCDFSLENKMRTWKDHNKFSRFPIFCDETREQTSPRRFNNQNWSETSNHLLTNRLIYRRTDKIWTEHYINECKKNKLYVIKPFLIPLFNNNNKTQTQTLFFWRNFKPHLLTMYKDHLIGVLVYLYSFILETFAHKIIFKFGKRLIFRTV